MKLSSLNSKNIKSKANTERAASTTSSLRVRSNVKAGPQYD